jgi:shikimate dehydrogenase
MTWEIPPDADILVNATSIGLFPDVNTKPDIVYDSISKNMIVCDVIPNPPLTGFLQQAAARGAKTLDGLGMLVYQGAIGFKMWTGIEAPVEVMHRALKEAFA